MRSQKSCNKLKTSFLELLSQSDGLPIRMTELLKLAGVSKTTFYVYYENLDQLAFDLIDEQLRELNAVLRLRRKNGEGESDYVVLTQWIEQHWEVLLLLNRSKYRSYLEQSLFPIGGIDPAATTAERRFGKRFGAELVFGLRLFGQLVLWARGK